MKFGEKLRDARVRRDMTQEAVARQIGVSRQSLSNWENDRTYPDLGSVLKLSDLYDLSLDDLLREDASLRKKLEQKKEWVKNLASYLHDFAMLLIAAAIPLAWLEKTGMLIAMGVTGILLVCVVHWIFVFRLGANGKVMALRSLAMVMWFGGWLIRVGSHHEVPAGEILWFAGISLDIYVDYRMDWEIQFPRHMTAFTGFVIAMVLVFGAIPFLGESMERGTFVEANPFNSRDYRVVEVLEGETERKPVVYLGSTTNIHLFYPGEEAQGVKGKFKYITQPEGVKTKGVWEMLQGETLYRITVEEDDSIIMRCSEDGKVRWEYRLEEAPRMGCTIQDVLGTVTGAAEWYYAGSLKQAPLLNTMPLRGKGTIKLSVPGDSPTVVIYEEYWDGNSVEHQTMTLTRDQRGFVEFQREARQSGQKQTGIYRIPYEDGEFVLAVKFAQ